MGIFGAIMIILTVYARIYTANHTIRVNVSYPEKKTLVRELEGYGVVRNCGEKAVFGITGQKIASIEIKEGQQINVGDYLYQIDLVKLQESIDEIDFQIKELNIQIAQYNNAEEQSNTQLSVDLERAYADYDTAVETANMQQEEAKKELAEAESNLNGFYNDTPAENKSSNEYEVELDNLQDNVNQKANQLQELQIKGNESIIQASRKIEDIEREVNKDSSNPSQVVEKEKLNVQLQKLKQIQSQGGKIYSQEAGCITDIVIVVGDVIGDAAVLKIGISEEGYQLLIEVTGDKIAQLDTYSEVNLWKGTQKIEGAGISTIKQKEEAENMFQIEISFSDKNVKNGDRIAYQINSSLGSFDQCIPVEVLHKSEKGTYFVYVLEQEEQILGNVDIARKINVSIIEENLSYVAVESIGDVQVIEPVNDDKLSDGDRIRVIR